MASHGINPDTRNVHKGMTDIMIDIETDGRNGLKNNMRQIAGKKFNIHTGEIGDDFFIANLHPLEGREEDPETMTDFWAKQNRDIFDSVFNDPENTFTAEQVMNAFADWCYPMNTLRFWGKPTHFDFVFVQSYFDQLRIPNPFHYRMAKDMNTFISGIYYPGDRPDDSETSHIDTGGAHNALNDVTNQISLLLAHVKHSQSL